MHLLCFFLFFSVWYNFIPLSKQLVRYILNVFKLTNMYMMLSYTQELYSKHRPSTTLNTAGPVAGPNQLSTGLLGKNSTLTQIKQVVATLYKNFKRCCIQKKGFITG